MYIINFTLAPSNKLSWDYSLEDASLIRDTLVNALSHKGYYSEADDDFHNMFSCLIRNGQTDDDVIAILNSFGISVSSDPGYCIDEDGIYYLAELSDNMTKQFAKKVVHSW